MHIHRKGKSSKVGAWKNTKSLESRCSSEYFWPSHDPRTIYIHLLYKRSSFLPNQIVCQQVPTKLGAIKYPLYICIYHYIIISYYIHISQCVLTRPNPTKTLTSNSCSSCFNVPFEPLLNLWKASLKTHGGVSTQSRSNSRVTGVKCCAAAVMTIRPTWPLPHFKRGTHWLYTTEIAGNPHIERENDRDINKARKWV